MYFSIIVPWNRKLPIFFGGAFAATLCQPAAALQSGPFTLDTGKATFVFEVAGSSLELTELDHDDYGGAFAGCDLSILPEPGSGGWNLLLRQEGGAPDCPDCTDVPCSSGSGCEDSAYCQTLTIATSPISQAGVVGGDGTFAFDGAPTVNYSPGVGVSAEWTGSGQFVRTDMSSLPFDLRVEVSWGTVGGGFVDARIEEVMLTFPPGEDEDVYLSRVEFPHIYIGELDQGAATCTADDQLIIPLGTGLLYTNPLDTANEYFYDESPNTSFIVSSTPAIGYYGTKSKRCFYLSDTNDDWWWLERYAIRRASGMLDFYYGHTPDDIFESLAFSPPYAVRVGAIVGDWVDVAKARRGYMRANSDWYFGPVGTAGNPMPSEMKQVVAHVQMGPGGDTTIIDNVDVLHEGVEHVKEVLGENLYLRFYRWHWPDQFAIPVPEGSCLPVDEEGFFNEQLLPGHPSFPSSLRQAAMQPGVIADFYWPCDSAVDSNLLPGMPPASTFNDEVRDSFIYDETLRLTQVGQTFFPQRLCDVADDFWSAHWQNELLRALKFSAADGLYLDCYGTTINYTTGHVGMGPTDLCPTPTLSEAPLHAPGGGNYWSAQLLDRLRYLQCELLGGDCLDAADVPAALAVEVPLSLTHEFAVWRLSELVHMQLIAPLESLGLGYGNEELVPFYRMVQDNVKLAAITKTPVLNYNANRRAWMAATDMLLFGQIFGLRHEGYVVLPPFGDRKKAAAWRFYGALSRLLRDQGFLAWHNGTLERLPQITVASNGFVEHTDFGADIAAVPPHSAPFFNAPLAAGMFRAYTGSPEEGTLAFVVANPMVAPDPAAGQGDFLEFSTTFKPSNYAGFKGGQDYSVRKYDPDPATGLWVESSVTPMAGGTAFVIDDESVASGEIEFWVFEKD